MTKTEKINELIKELKARKRNIVDKINELQDKIEKLQGEIALLRDDLYNTHIEIGECEYALAEIDYIDNGNNY